MSTLLITGAGGFVGCNLARYFAPRQRVLTGYFRSQVPPELLDTTTSVQIDIRDLSAVMAAFERLRPEIVIHAAGNKDLRYCEAHPEEAYLINTLGTRNVANACERIGSYLVYLSTDLVFECTAGNYAEEDPPRPTLVYGRTKLEGEVYAAQATERVAVCRSGGIYGRGSPVLRWLATELEAGHNIECFADVFNTPTYVDNLAEMVDRIVDQRLVGIFHTVGRERVSRYEFFKAYAQIFGYYPALLSPHPAGSRKAELLLQTDASLNSDHTSARLGLIFNNVAEGLTRLKVAGGYNAKACALHLE